MPPRVATAQAVGTGPESWYNSIPPITRTFATAIFLVTLGWRLDLLRYYWISLDWSRIFSQLEVWRLATNFFFIGKFSFQWLIQLLWLLQYGKTLESSTYQFDPAGFLYMLLFGAGCLLALSAATAPLGFILPFYGSALIYMILYVWSRQFPDQQASIFGLFSIPAFYVPFAFVAINVLMGGMPWGDIMGIVVGHMYHFVHDIYPATSGMQLLRTPRFLQNLLADWGVGARVNTHAASGQDAFRAFRGSGRRLGAD